MTWSLCIVVVAVVLALAVRPWRLLGHEGLLTPLLAALVILPWMWALPRLHWQEVVNMMAWLGVVPATLSLGVGALLRRIMGPNPFVYILGRAFLGTALCMFVAGGLAQLGGQKFGPIDTGLSMVARWLMAWGDAVVTGMCAAIFVAFKPQWLATWSDALYLRKLPP